MSGSHRRPPMPKWPGAGHCKWCGEGGVLKPAIYWHKACVTHYRVASFSSDQRHAVWERDRGHCAACPTVSPRSTVAGFRNLGVSHSVLTIGRERHMLRYSAIEPIIRPEWEADHIRPLWSAPGDMALSDREAWFGMSNLQTLCQPCHKAKTAREAMDRAAIRSGQGSLLCEGVL